MASLTGNQLLAAGAHLPPGISLMERPVVIILHGPSGVGKDSVIDALRLRTGIHRATSSTNRARRDYEQHGEHYHFLTTAEFEAKVRRGEFAEHAKVYGDWKGLEAREITVPLDEGRDVIIRTDVQGARTWRKKLAGAVSVILLAEDEDVLWERLESRGTESAESLAKRRAELEEELADIPNNQYIIRNRHGLLDDAVSELSAIIMRERQNPNRDTVRLL